MPKYPRYAAVRLYPTLMVSFLGFLSVLFLDDSISDAAGMALVAILFLIGASAFLLTIRLSAKAIESNLKLCDKCAAPFTTGVACKRCRNKLDHKRIDAMWRTQVLKFQPKMYRSGLKPLKRQYRPGIICFPLSILPLAAILIYQLTWNAQPGGGGGISMTLLVAFGTAYPALTFASIMLFVGGHRKVRRICERAKKNRLCLCESCLYPVDSTVPAGTCPECGKAYTTHDLRRRWYMAWGSIYIDKAIHMKVPLSHEEPSSIQAVDTPART